MLRRAPALLVLLLLALPSALAAETVTVEGAPGVPGVDGLADESGGDGSDGESATALAESTDAINEATAIGGAGGRGGDGGEPSPGAPFTAGGDGGRGGDAFAAARSTGPSSGAFAEALGGSGGGGGRGLPRFSGLPGARGRGGDAWSEASVVGVADVDARSQSIAGSGIADGLGGSAHAESTAATQGAFSGYASAEAGEASSGFGPSGGDATAISSASSQGGDVTSSARAFAGGAASGDDPGRHTAGSAVARAFGETTGDGDVEIIAEATGGDGRLLLDDGPMFRGGTAEIDAFGRSGTGSVSVSGIATAGSGTEDIRSGAVGGPPGVDVHLANAVGGETSGDLALSQTAVAGRSGFGQTGSGDAGNASSVLARDHRGAGDLELAVLARGGDSYDRGRSGDAFASASGIGDGDVRIDVQAHAGFGSGERGEALLGDVFGESTGGGDVHVSVFREADGDVSMIDVPDGRTTGSLTLEQFASSRRATGASELTVHGEYDSLGVVSKAAGFVAEASADAWNRTGDVRVDAATVTISGTASNDVRARATTDGSEIVVGEDLVAPFLVYFPHGTGAQGHGDAISRSEGIHDGDGAVTVRDLAGAGVFSTSQGPVSARSTAIARNAGTSRVEARATAYNVSVPGDEIVARSEAVGLGEVLSVAGATSPSGRSRVNLAEATARGSSGSARAQAAANLRHGFVSRSIRVHAEAEVASDARVRASTAMDPSELADATGVDSWVDTVLEPDRSLTDVLLETRPDFAAALDENFARVVTLAEMGVHTGQGEGILLEGALEITSLLGAPVNDPRPTQAIVLAFDESGLDPTGPGFALTILRNGRIEVDVRFDDGADALAWLAGRVLVFEREGVRFGDDEDPPVGLDIRIAFEDDGSGRVSRLGLLVGVPEPRLAALLVLACAWIAAWRRRESAQR